MQQATEAHPLTSRESKLERQATRKDWYPTYQEFCKWASKLKPNYTSEEMTNVFQTSYP